MELSCIYALRHRIHLRSYLITETIIVGVCSNPHVYGVTLLLEHNITRNKVVDKLFVISKPVLDVYHLKMM